MAHIYALARGINDKLKRFENDMSAQYLPYKYKNPQNGKVEQGAIRLSMRPIQLYEIVCPEDQIEEVLGMIHPNGEVGYKTKHPILEKIRKHIHKLLGLRKLPKKWGQPKEHIVVKDAVGVHPIGWKKDKYDKDGVEKL